MAKLRGAWCDSSGKIVDVNDVRLLLVSRWYTRCSADWVETYRRVGVHRDRRDAVATAEQTYKGGP